MRRIAISDIHGCVKSFRALVEDQVVLSKKDELVLLGDYVDRGPNSRGVLDYVMDLQAKGFRVICLKGNHEDMMIKAIQDPTEASIWLANGGKQALISFDVAEPHRIPAKYIDFIGKMEYYYEAEGFIFVHAGLNFTGPAGEEPKRESSKREGGKREGGKRDKQKEGFLWRMSNPLKDTESMMWIRYWYNDIDWHWLRDRIIVHGHTPITTDEIWDLFDSIEESQVIDIDNGCFARQYDGMGQLCAFDTTNRELYFQTNID